MSGDEFQEDVVLAAARPLKLTSSAETEGENAGTANSNQSFRQSMNVDATIASGLEEIFLAHRERVFRVAYRITGSGADAEDVLQTVFLRIARGQDSVLSADNPHAYFTRAAINASLDLLRSRKRSKTVAIDSLEGPASIAASGKNPEAKQQDRELRKLIRLAVSQLGGSSSQMFVLRYFEGYSNIEIAKIMKTSPLVVGVTLHRARTRLRKEIGRYLQSHPAS